MKVGTDGVLLGAWCPIERFGTQDSRLRILDVGTGSGLIALMLAQRCPEAQISAIDIDAAAVAQAQENFNHSPWADRLRAQHISLQELAASRLQTFHLIVSNPPYFIDSLKNPDKQRQVARHTDSLSYNELITCAAKLLHPEGALALILPAESEADILTFAKEAGLSPTRLTHVYSKPGKAAKRLLVCFAKSTRSQACLQADFYIESETSPRSEEYAFLTRDFYL